MTLPQQTQGEGLTRHLQLQGCAQVFVIFECISPIVDHNSMILLAKLLSGGSIYLSDKC